MITVGTAEAEARFATLLDLVARGEEVTITKHGKPVARLVPASAASREQVDEVIAKLKALHRVRSSAGFLEGVARPGRPGERLSKSR